MLAVGVCSRGHVRACWVAAPAEELLVVQAAVTVNVDGAVKCCCRVT
jgi:hypothetical protein